MRTGRRFYQFTITYHSHPWFADDCFIFWFSTPAMCGWYCYCHTYVYTMADSPHARYSGSPCVAPHSICFDSTEVSIASKLYLLGKVSGQHGLTCLLQRIGWALMYSIGTTHVYHAKKHHVRNRMFLPDILNGSTSSRQIIGFYWRS